ncbi:carbonic anhydrase [Paraburkholderia humisilvae]|uniref:Carbonic anhydrase n=1 Tax=Paraburkholderia humisilvae TaxID=627669 RepID=A0A6J5F6D0_9BURK|nr:carbonic anhydrase [Paraburkholderia humisilvae]CAB3774430.1 hypothetical protein LMG29542_07807 [Paraburkholderia humisilvae]
MCDSKTCLASVPSSPRRKFLRETGASAIAVTIGGLLTSKLSVAAEVTVVPKPENVLSPDDAIKRLMEGNARYVSGVTRRQDFAHDRDALIAGQNPYAAVLSCADSRVAPEFAFDSSRGDLFVTRVAGNVVDDDVLGSLEYAVAVLKVPVILVLGHDKCGAVGAAINVVIKGATYPGKIQSLAMTIVPAVNKVKGKAGNLLDAAIAQNVRNSMADLRSSSMLIREAEGLKKIKIVGGVYRLSDGKVGLLG